MNAAYYNEILMSYAINEIVVDFAIQLLDQDIAATLIVWLRTRHPSGFVGEPLLEVLSQ